MMRPVAVPEARAMQTNAEDAQMRSLACRQLNSRIVQLLQLEDMSLLQQVAFVRSLVRLTDPQNSTNSIPNLAATLAPTPAAAVEVDILASIQRCQAVDMKPAMAAQMDQIFEQIKKVLQALEVSVILFRYIQVSVA